jgi:type VI secretion system protein ImpM
MADMSSTGIYGKLPAHGDFISRNLPTHFLNLWDAWLQGYIASSQEQLGEAWLDIYLTSPVWRFALSAGVLDEGAWLGIVLPSVDRVGRYFPFSIVRRIPTDLTPVAAITSCAAWLDGVELAALGALESGCQVDELIPELDRVPLSTVPLYRQAGSVQAGVGVVVPTDPVECQPLSAIPYVLDASLQASLRSYSAWTTAGSELVEPCFFYSSGLPPRRGIAAMLDGTWQARNWHQPLSLLNPVGC